MIKNYVKFIKIEHTLLSLPVVFSGTILALTMNGSRESMTLREVLLIFFAVLGARSAAFGLNRIIDRNIDAANPRTKNREIPSGEISLKSAWFFVIVSSLIFIISAGMLSQVCLMLSPIPLVLFSLYPFAKRCTLWSHLWLGFAWGIAPIGGWLAVQPHLSPISKLIPVFLLSAFCIFWVAGFDIIYALLDEEFDREKKLYSMPAVLGGVDALRVSEIFHFIALMFLGSLVQLHLNHSLSFLFLAIVALLFVVSHWRVQTQPELPSVVDFAFFKVNAVLSFVVFLLIAV